MDSMIPARPTAPNGAPNVEPTIDERLAHIEAKLDWLCDNLNNMLQLLGGINPLQMMKLVGQAMREHTE